jgi:acetyl esterase/lipase
MKSNGWIFLLAGLLWLTTGASTWGNEPSALPVATTVPLWPGGQIPGRASAGPERELPARGDNVIRLTEVTTPTIAVFKASGAKSPTPAIIICPGGGYGALAYNKEGTEVAAWLNTIGITGIVLKYRVPSNQDGAFQDIQRAIRLVRHRAAEWNISPKQIGVLGFSAGGHLSARLSTNADKATYPRLDAVDDEKLRPDFAILVYPAYLSKAPGKLSEGLPVTDTTPPTFLAHAEDDKSFIAGSKVYHATLQAAKIPTEFFHCASGGHGHGLRSDKEIKVWPTKCQEWLVKMGIL